jgi:hypothetical protein
MATLALPTEFAPLTTTREERGREIAKRGGIRQRGGVFVVPSQSDGPSYTVDLADETCTCPDYETRRLRCKHVEAALFYVAWEGSMDGMSLVSVDGTGAAKKPKRKTYKRNHAASNDASRHELERIRPLLRALCARVPEPDREVGLPGRKPIPLRDLIFAIIMKVYGGLSGRRTESEIRLCAKYGYITAEFQHNKIHSTMEDDGLTAILEWLVEESAAPLAVVENAAGRFSQDTTGFTTRFYDRWFAIKHGSKRGKKPSTEQEKAEAAREVEERKAHPSIKLHATTGAITHVVTCAKVSREADCKRLPEQLQRTAERFDVKEFSADKGYLDEKCIRAIAAIGARPLIPFKRNSIDHPYDRAWSVGSLPTAQR